MQGQMGMGQRIFLDEGFILELICSFGKVSYGVFVEFKYIWNIIFVSNWKYSEQVMIFRGGGVGIRVQ